MTDYHSRAIAPQVRAALDDMPVVVITGMRQTGKSTFLQRQKELQGSRCIAIEVKDKKRWDAGDLSGLKAFIEATPQCITGILAYNGTETVRLGEKIWAVPAGMIIS
jgi:predicted AAA+ superfamily ATPase